MVVSAEPRLPLRVVLVGGRCDGPIVMIAVVVRLRSNRLVGAPRMAGLSRAAAWPRPACESGGWIGAGACAGRLWSPKSGVRKAC